MILPVEGMEEEWEFIQRVVSMAQPHWHCLHEGQVFLWLTRAGKDRRDAGGMNGIASASVFPVLEILWCLA